MGNSNATGRNTPLLDRRVELIFAASVARLAPNVNRSTVNALQINPPADLFHYLKCLKCIRRCRQRVCVCVLQHPRPAASPTLCPADGNTLVYTAVFPSHDNRLDPPTCHQVADNGQSPVMMMSPPRHKRSAALRSADKAFHYLKSWVLSWGLGGDGGGASVTSKHSLTPRLLKACKNLTIGVWATMRTLLHCTFHLDSSAKKNMT